MSSMRFAYADPPYLGNGKRYDHPDARLCDTVEWHQDLIKRLSDEYDGWALSMASTNLRTLLPLCPVDVRIMAWVKPFAVFRPNVNPAYTWEPVVVRNPRKKDRFEPTVRDFLSANITLKKGLVGAKPDTFCDWILDVLGVTREDTMEDLFPGTGGMGRALLRRFPT